MDNPTLVRRLEAVDDLPGNREALLERQPGTSTGSSRTPMCESVALSDSFGQRRTFDELHNQRQGATWKLFDSRRSARCMDD